MSDDFDWEDEEAVVLAPRRALAVYLNKRGDVVIRQQGDWPDEDIWIVFPAEDAEYVAHRIIQAATDSRASETTTGHHEAAEKPAEPQRSLNDNRIGEAPELPLVARAAE